MRQIRPLSNEDLPELIRIRSIAFGPAGSFEEAAEALRPRIPNTLGAFEGDRLRSVATMFPFQAYVAGERVALGGLGAVATAPEARRRGHVAALLRAWFARLHEDGVGWSGEFPFDPAFYARYGYQSVPNGRMLELAPRVFRTGVVAEAEAMAPEDAATLAPIHADFARRFSFALTRDDGARDDWTRLPSIPWRKTHANVYALDDAYVMFWIDEDGPEPVLVVRDFAYRSGAGRDGLMQFLAAFDGHIERVRIHVPPGDPLLLDHGPWHSVKTPLLQVRVVDVAAALGRLRTPFPRRFTLRVRDDDCDWNDAVFAVDLATDGCEVRFLGKPAEDADASLHVRALAALLGHAAPPETLLADGHAEGDLSAMRAIASASASHPPFTMQSDYY
ncbi:MAG: GNAT family N-acetyltransferase [Trueperaceae bacterium]